MDLSALESLFAVYKDAPSPQLAKAIVKGCIDLEELQRAIPLINEMEVPEDASEYANILKALSSENEIELLEDFTSKDAIVDMAEVFRCLLDLPLELSKVQEIYNLIAGDDQQRRHIAVERMLGLDTSSISAVEEPRAKLRVIEKPNIAEVTDLSRYQEKTTTFDDVVGLEAIKKQINKKIIMPFQKPSLFQKFKKKIGGGVLLYGPPGCGKTLLARATAGECNASFFNVEISDVLNMYIGESEQNLHAIFEKARSETPSVIFFDELEALAGKREHSRNSSSSNTVSQFLTELDGFAQRNSGVLVLASTNVPWSIDSAFLRPGRFDRMFFVPPPDKTARKSILEHHMKGRPHQEIDFAMISTKTSGYSGADLANLVEMAADEAIDESLETNQDVDISSAHFKEALSESRSTTVEWLTTARNYARYANDGGRYNDVLDFLKKHGK